MKADDPRGVFEVATTEFVILIAFVLLIVVAAYAQMHEEDGRAGTEMSEAAKVAQNIAEKLGLELAAPKDDQTASSDVVMKFLNWLNRVVTSKIELEENWENIVFVVGKLEAGLTLSDIDRAAELQEENEELKAENYKLKGELQRCANKLGENRERCGTGYPICLGDGIWLANLTLEESFIDVEPLTFPIDMVHQFKAAKYSLEEFALAAAQFLSYSRSQTLECRFQVRWRDATNPNSKKRYKDYLDAINQYFYGKEVYADF